MTLASVRSAILILSATAAAFPAALRAGDGEGKDTASSWRIPPEAHLITRWGREVSPSRVHPEYPRPQMVRTEWKNLNGMWQYAEAHEGEPAPSGKKLNGEILVPFPIESALSGVMKSAGRIWYRRMFDIPHSWRGKRVLLNFGAVDWETTVYVNGTRIGDHRGGYDPFSFDITGAVRQGEEQELIAGVYDPSDGGDQPRGKQVNKPEGIWYTSTTGIWQTVWLEPVPVTHIAGIAVDPNVDSSSVSVTIAIAGATGKEHAVVSVLASGRIIATESGDAGGAIPIRLHTPHLWSPGDPFLYDLEVELERGGRRLDSAGSYFGMRKVAIGKDAGGTTRILLNGTFTMEVGPLDQGFWPDGLYTAPSDEAVKFDIATMKSLGFTMARKHVKVEPERWYYWADRLGLLIWQDMPSARNSTPEAKTQFEAELARMIAARRNHPSIIMWVVFNEGWGQYDTERLTSWVKELDPSRLVNSASGWDDKNSGSVADIHSYPMPKSPPAEEARAIVLGEFGGLGLAIPGHTWKKEHWGYQGMTNRVQLTSKYESYLERVYALKDDPGLSAAVYTQLTDVEVECNGLLTYDRAVLKPVAARIAAANRGDFSQVPPAPAVRAVVPTSEDTAQEWRYTFEEPPKDWFTPGFDASGWKSGPGGFGTKGTPGAIVRTEWKAREIWLRRDALLSEAIKALPEVRMHHDDDAEFYINGILAGSYPGYTSEYEDGPISGAARSALKPGRITLALHCRQVSGGQYIDAGIVEVLPAARGEK